MSNIFLAMITKQILYIWPCSLEYPLLNNIYFEKIAKVNKYDNSLIIFSCLLTYIGRQSLWRLFHFGVARSINCTTFFTNKTFQSLEFKCHLCKTHSYFEKKVSLLFINSVSKMKKKLLMGLASQSSPMSNTLVRIASNFQREILLKKNEDVLRNCWQDIN